MLKKGIEPGPSFTTQPGEGLQPIAAYEK